MHAEPLHQIVFASPSLSLSRSLCLALLHSAQRVITRVVVALAHGDLEREVAERQRCRRRDFFFVVSRSRSFLTLDLLFFSRTSEVRNFFCSEFHCSPPPPAISFSLFLSLFLSLYPSLF